LKLKGLIWLEEIVDKLYRKHSVIVAEVRQVINGKPRFRYVEKGAYSGEDLYIAMRKTGEGRYLVIFFIYKQDGNGLVLSARDMTSAERRKYEKK
jgi:uncharacterized DUF497 family protein